MEFDRLFFIMVFLPLFIGGFYLLKNSTFRNPYLLIASLLFYALADLAHFPVLLLLIVISYAFGRIINRKKGLYALYLLLVIAALSFFKYGNYCGESLRQYLTTLSFTKIAMPLGISFYTFSSISYISDVYYGKMEAEKSIWKLAAYLSFFPIVISGPLTRYEVFRNYYEKKEIESSSFAEGMRTFILGLAQKVIFANQLALVTQKIFQSSTQLSFLLAAYGVIAFAIQEYYDFAGYSAMAIGLGKMVGIEIPENFNAPYFSHSISEYWRRWHMTLGRFFRDYLYIPLGGNRKGKLRTFLNTMAIFVISGLWHGNTWGFLLWGVINGLFVALNAVFKEKYAALRKALYIKEESKIYRAFQILRTDAIEFLLSALFFQCATIMERKKVLKALLFRGSPFQMFYTRSLGVLAFLPLLFLAALMLFPKWKEVYAKMKAEHPLVTDVFLLTLLLVSILLSVSGSYTSFIYFNF